MRLNGLTATWLTRPRWIALVLIVGVAAIAVGAWQLNRWWQERPLGQAARAALLEELKPVVLKNCTLKRVGGPHDSGYLMCDNLSEGVQSAYSYGIGIADDFGCEVSKRYSVPVHQYDCFDPGRPTCQGGVAHFNNECIGPRPERDKRQRVFDTLKNQIAKNQDTGKRLLVKMDIEGAEWDSLLATPDAVLDQIDQMPMEMHAPFGFKRRYFEMIRRLKDKFYLVNLHFNNNSCTPDVAPFPGWAFQVLWVNKRLGVLDESAPTPAPMSKLNAPDNPRVPDCQLPSRP